MMMGSEGEKKFVLVKMTALKHDGFKKYQSLPPQQIFQHTYSVLGTELEVKVKQKQLFFNRKTDWMFLPVYLVVNKGLLFVYLTQDSGYALRISTAKKINFEGAQKKKRNAKAYSAVVSLQYPFGEIKIKFDNAEVCRYWRAILLAAHESLMNLTMVGQEVASDVLSKSPSMESVVSAQSVYPDDGDKDKSDKVAVHRHPILCSAHREVNNNNSQSLSPSSGSSVAEPSMMIHNCSILARQPEVAAPPQPSKVKEAGSNSSLWDENEEEEESKIQPALDHSTLFDFSSHVGTSEVDVTLRDVERPLAWQKSVEDGILSLGAGMEEQEDGTANSHTTACKTSPTQMTHQSSIASIASRKSMFLEDYRHIEETIPEIETIVKELNHTTPRKTSTPQVPPESPSSWSDDGKLVSCDSTTFFSNINECVHDLSKVLSGNFMEKKD